MKCAFAVVGAIWVLEAYAQPKSYSRVTTLSKGTQLVVTRSDGTKISIPKDDGQDAFDKVQISSDGRYVGWLDMQSNLAASYLQPIGVTVLDTSNRMHRLRGDFGLVFGWCFGEKAGTVIYTYSFPHGATPVGFDMRRLSDDKLLRRVRVRPPKPDEGNDKLVRDAAPAWALCAWNSEQKQ